MISLHRILMATDFSDYSKEALDYAVYLARHVGGDVYLLHVFEPPFFSRSGVSPNVRPEVHQWIKEVKEEEARKLNALAEEVRHHGAKVHAVFKEGEAFLEILKTEGEIPADLIVLGTHGRTGLAHVLMGSVAERVVRKAVCPVFTVRPKASAAAKEKKGP
ncbi:MAG: universal stress protein [Nitrospirae bacterium]|nr:universal stress protein [Nitrospirota bacterium]